MNGGIKLTMRNPKPTKASTVHPIKSKRDRNKIIAALHGRNQLMFRLGVAFGLRITDLLNLKVGQVRGKKEAIVIEQKTRKARTITVSRQLQKELTHLEGDDNDYIFKSRQGANRPISRQRAYQVLNNAIDRAGLKDKVGTIGTHSLRKTFGYILYQQNYDLARLQKILGHSSQKVTLRYIGIEDEEIAEAYESIDI